MNPAPNPLIEAAVAPLSDNAEHRLAAISILAEAVDPDHPGAAEAIARWQAVDHRKIPFLWKPVLYLVAALTVILAVSSQLPDLKLAWSYRDLATLSFPDPTLPEEISAPQKLVLGDPSQTNFEQKEALHKSNPENPAYYAEYADGYEREFGELPAGYFETVARIAPRNAYFLYMAVGMITGNDVIEQKEPAVALTGDGVATSPVPAEDEYEIKDEAAFRNSLELLEKAAALPEYDDYQAQMFAERVKALPKGGTFAERLNSTMLLSMGSSGRFIHLKPFTLLSAGAYHCSNTGDTEGFLKLDRIRRHLTRSLLDSPPITIIADIVLIGWLPTATKDFHHDARRLGLQEISDELLLHHLALKESHDRRKLRRSKADNSWISEHGSILTETSLDMVMNIADSPPPLRVEDLAPLRHAEHALAMRAGLCACALALLASFALVFLFRFLFPPALRKTASRLVQLLRAGDWVFAVGLGVVLPISLVLALQHLTDLGGRGWALGHFQYLFPGVHLVVLLLLPLLAACRI